MPALTKSAKANRSSLREKETPPKVLQETEAWPPPDQPANPSPCMQAGRHKPGRFQFPGCRFHPDARACRASGRSDKRCGRDAPHDHRDLHPWPIAHAGYRPRRRGSDRFCARIIVRHHFGKSEARTHPTPLRPKVAKGFTSPGPLLIFAKCPDAGIGRGILRLQLTPTLHVGLTHEEIYVKIIFLV